MPQRGIALGAVAVVLSVLSAPLAAQATATAPAGVELPRPPEQISALWAGQASPSHAVNVTGPVRLRITSPENGLRLLRDPETPPEQSTLALTVVVDPPVPQVVWYVDGRPYETVAYPYTTRWKLEPGDHLFQVKLPLQPGGSPGARVVVQ